MTYLVPGFGPVPIRSHSEEERQRLARAMAELRTRRPDGQRGKVSLRNLHFFLPDPEDADPSSTKIASSLARW